MLLPNALKCDRRDRGVFWLIDCVWLLDLWLNFPPVSPIYGISCHFWQWIKYTTYAESQVWLPGVTVLSLMKTYVALSMYFLTWHYVCHTVCSIGAHNQYSSLEYIAWRSWCSKKFLFEFYSECFLQITGTEIVIKMSPAYENENVWFVSAIPPKSS